jgi:hypothetical protein
MFLSLNGIRIPVVNASAAKRIERMGRRERSYRGALRDSRRGLRRAWNLDLCFPDYAEGEAFVRLIQGEGHFVDFSSGIEASTGLLPVGNPRIELRPGQWGPRGRGVAVVPSTLTTAGTPNGFLRYDAQLPEEWTVLWFERGGVATGGSYETGGWVPFGLRADGAGYKAGTLTANVGDSLGTVSNASVTVQGGDLILRNGPEEDFGIDDLLILPYALPDSWMATLTGLSAPKWPALPVLSATGDFLEQDRTYVVGAITGIRYQQRGGLVPGVGWLNNAMLISATLAEVEPTFYGLGGRYEETPLPGIAEPYYWYSAQDVDGRANASLREGDSIATWANLGTLASADLAPLDAATPIFHTGGRNPNLYSPVLEFDTTSRRMSTVQTTIAQPNTGIFIYRVSTTTTNTRYATDGASGSGRHIFKTGPASSQQVYAGTFLGTGHVAAQREWNVAGAVLNGVSSVYRFNGGQTSGNASTQGLAGVCIGGLYNNTGFPPVGDIVELLWYNGAPSASIPTLEELEAYAAAKYGITL